MAYAAHCYVCERGTRMEEARLSVHREKCVTLCRKCGREVLQYLDMMHDLDKIGKTHRKKGGGKK